MKIEILPACTLAGSPRLPVLWLFLNDLAQPLIKCFLHHRIQCSIFAHLIALVSRSCISLIIINTQGHSWMAVLRVHTLGAALEVILPLDLHWLSSLGWGPRQNCLMLNFIAVASGVITSIPGQYTIKGHIPNICTGTENMLLLISFHSTFFFNNQV